LAAVTKQAATGAIAEIFADIRQNVGVVNPVWRHLATMPDCFEWILPDLARIQCRVINDLGC
jgi:hypothetical protein